MYQLEAEQEYRELLSTWEDKKAVKIKVGKAALVETAAISRLQARLNTIIANARLGIILEVLADTYATGKIEVGKPTLRFCWASR